MQKTLKKTFSVLLSVLMLLSVFGGAAVPASAQTGTQSKTALLDRMSTEEKVAQMLMPTFRYYNGAGVTTLSEKAKSILEKRGFAGMILFAQNNASTAQAVELIDEMQTANAKGANRTQLLISVDTQDFDVVMRIMNEVKFGETYVNREHFEAFQGFHQGVRQSGLGGDDGERGLDEFLETHICYVDYDLNAPGK